MRNEDVRPNEYVLATTLKACSLSLDVELGRQVHAEAVKAGLLTDLFVASGLVDLYAKCKEIELADGQVHVFVSQDGSHPKTEQIYAKLQDLKQRLSFSGYIPKTENVLHNISSREKIEHLWHHSERLALGLALISASPGMPIRIFKNLRICEDCHEVMKVISYVTSREIVIRDFKRFHHFKLGSCSCQDSW
ncbi:unnamed protein product [Linum tenue]|uniref:DYW domain-containing protein n=1 Tax=Linum tenue TaxID=586396 RepID=A0AAV0QHR1_9ROSI|nr:unnamed protein product [Linum tenue]CAI0628409.1 unnamed protein product [Linum tenue]